MQSTDDANLNEVEGLVVRKRRKGIYVLPNLFTLAALFCGFYSIVMAVNGRFDLAAVGVFCAMVLDSLDGRVARMTNTQSAFGEQMDSLADMVSFGAAPALISYIWALRDLGKWGWFAAFVYCACAALRLARFNVNTAVVDKRYFQGLPSPAAAAANAQRGRMLRLGRPGHGGAVAPLVQRAAVRPGRTRGGIAGQRRRRPTARRRGQNLTVKPTLSDRPMPGTETPQGTAVPAMVMPCPR